MEADLFEGNTAAREKVNRALGILRKVYYESSNVEKLVRVRDAKADEKDILNLYFRHLVPKEWFTKPEYYVDLVFKQFGTNLAISEEKYIIDRIFEAKNIPTRNLGENVLEDFIAEFEAFSDDRRVDSLLIPIDFYVPLYTEWPRRSTELIILHPTNNIKIGNTQPKIFWSNKYTPFSNIVLMNKQFGEWISKPSFKERLEVKISQSDREDTLDLLFLTKVQFSIVDARKILILHPQLPK